MTGTVVTYIATKGYGFIAPDDGGNNVYVSKSSLVGCTELTVGDQVSFDTISTAKGIQAINVQIITK